jgi:hypothetical protein
VVSGLDLQSKGCGFESRLVLSKILDGNGLKANPGLIPAPNSGSFVEKNRKNMGSQMGQTDKKTLKTNKLFFKHLYITIYKTVINLS